MFDCKACMETFTEVKNYTLHLESEKHKNKMLASSINENGSSVVPNDDVTSSSSECYECKVCDLSYNSFDSFVNHSLSPEHALKIMLNQSKSCLTQSPSFVNNNNEQDDAKLKEDCILPELSNPKSPFSNGSCSVCCKVFSGPEPYKQHIESQAHIKKVALLQNSASVGINVNLRCEPCDKSFSGQVPYAQHMSSEIHKKKMQNIENMKKYLSVTDSSNSQVSENKMVEENRLWFCNVCNKQCSGLIPYEQHMAGSLHYKNAKKAEIQNSLMKMSNNTTPTTQASHFNQGHIFEKSENVPKLVNGNCLNEKKENDFVLSGLVNGLKVVSNEELGEKVKVILPDEEINFDQSDETADMSKPSEIQNDNEFDDKLQKEPGEVKKSDVYEICKICNVPLLDKDAALEHYESKEHYEKRWK